MKLVSCSPYSLRFVAFVLCVSLSAQDTGRLQPRQLYYKSKSALETEQKNPEQKTPPAGQTAKSTTKGGTHHRLKTTVSEKSKPEDKGSAEPDRLGLKYTVEQVTRPGKYVQVDPDKTFKTGDGIRLRMEVNTDAYVYLLKSDGAFLFPETGEDNRLKAYQSVQVPAAGDPIVFAEPAGTETLYILVSRSPVPELERLLPARGSSPRTQPSAARMMAANVPSAQLGELVAHAEQLQSRDLIRGKVSPESDPGPAGMNEHAVYALTSTAPDAQVLQKLELNHR